MPDDPGVDSRSELWSRAADEPVGLAAGPRPVKQRQDADHEVRDNAGGNGQAIAEGREERVARDGDAEDRAKVFAA